MESVKERFDKFLYKDLEAYEKLSDADQVFFDKLFSYLIYYGEINWSNRKLCDMTGENESTLEKRLKRLEKATLITREVSKQCINGVWKTVDRIIKLNPFNFEFDYNSMAHRIFVNYLFMQKTEFVMEKYLSMDFNDFKKVYGEIKVVNV